MERYIKEVKTVLDAKAANGVGTSIDIQRYTDKEIVLSHPGTANLTVKFQVSHSEDAPDFSAAQSSTNEWDYVRVKDLQSGDYVAGDTGVALAAPGTADVRLFNVESNNAKWFNAIVSSFVAGSVTVRIKSASHN